MSIRRFDVFSVFNFIKNTANGMEEDQAKGEAIWLAKVVASRGRGGGGGGGGKSKDNVSKPGKPAKLWKELSGIPQTDKLYEKEIVQHMGQDLYARVLEQIRTLYFEGKSYKNIRDCGCLNEKGNPKRGWCDKCLKKLEKKEKAA